MCYNNCVKNLWVSIRLNLCAKLVLVLLCFSSQVFSEQYGVLNVFTDLPKAIIYVDGLVAGQESVVKLALPVGEHYVQVKLNDKLVYAEKAIIHDNRSTTVVSEHFVDIITKTPSRGAIDREAARLRETRGALAIGIAYQTAPQPVASLKWWGFQHVGFQFMALGALEDTPYHGLVGGRMFFSPADKVFNDDVLTGYVFTGGGMYRSEINYDPDELTNRFYLECGVGVEAKIGDLANNLFKWKYQAQPVNRTIKQKRKTKNKDGETVEEETEVKEGEGFGGFVRDLMFLAAVNIGYTSAEVTMIKAVGKPIQTGFNVGIHFYF
jgi:hypothetical protein